MKTKLKSNQPSSRASIDYHMAHKILEAIETTSEIANYRNLKILSVRLKHWSNETTFTVSHAVSNGQFCIDFYTLEPAIKYYNSLVVSSANWKAAGFDPPHTIKE
jgi:hypothetical protein